MKSVRGLFPFIAMLFLSQTFAWGQSGEHCLSDVLREATANEAVRIAAIRKLSPRQQVALFRAEAWRKKVAEAKAQAIESPGDESIPFPLTRLRDPAVDQLQSADHRPSRQVILPPEPEEELPFPLVRPVRDIPIPLVNRRNTPGSIPKEPPTVPYGSAFDPVHADALAAQNSGLLGPPPPAVLVSPPNGNTPASKLFNLPKRSLSIDFSAVNGPVTTVESGLHSTGFDLTRPSLSNYDPVQIDAQAARGLAPETPARRLPPMVPKLEIGQYTAGHQVAVKAGERGRSKPVAEVPLAAPHVTAQPASLPHAATLVPPSRHCCQTFDLSEPISFAQDLDSLGPEQRKYLAQLTDEPDIHQPNTYPYRLSAEGVPYEDVPGVKYNRPKTITLRHQFDFSEVQVFEGDPQVLLDRIMEKKGYTARGYTATRIGKGSANYTYFVHLRVPINIRGRQAKLDWIFDHSVKGIKIRYVKNGRSAEAARKVAFRDIIMTDFTEQLAKRFTFVNEEGVETHPIVVEATDNSGAPNAYSEQNPVKKRLLRADFIDWAVSQILDSKTGLLRPAGLQNALAVSILKLGKFVNDRGQITAVSAKRAWTREAVLQQFHRVTHPDAIKFQFNNDLEILASPIATKGPNGKSLAKPIGVDASLGKNAIWDPEGQAWHLIDL